MPDADAYRLVLIHIVLASLVAMVQTRPVAAQVPTMAAHATAVVAQAELAVAGWRFVDLTHPQEFTPVQLYEAACARCHGTDGTGPAPGSVSFDEPVPDFTECSFASREPDGDWIAVAHQGGPVRGFSETMPAFGDALSEEMLQLTIDHIRTMCSDNRWPRGELNLPRPLVTEKAYPEDEAVSTFAMNTEGDGAASVELLYEKRFGPRSQFEIKVPFGAVEQSPDDDWDAGIQDVTLGLKHTLFSSLAAGSILSAGVEVKLPIGDENVGLGKGTSIFEGYLAYGQIVAGDGFFHLQALGEVPADGDAADPEAKWRGAFGWTFTQGGFGRSWTPMVEILGQAEFQDPGQEVDWDLLPQIQVSLNTRQHVLANVGLRIPVTDSDLRSSELLIYILWDWFDGGFFDGW